MSLTAGDVLQNRYRIVSLLGQGASGFKLGLLLNFGASRLQIKRLVN